jgi:hypothetical protein
MCAGGRSEFGTTATFARHSNYVGIAAKVRAHDRAALVKCAVIRDCLGNVSFRGLSRRSAEVDEGPFRATPRKDRMTGLGHEPTFSTFQNTVGFPLETRHSVQNVGNPPVNRPSGAAKRRSVLCHELPLARSD